MVDGDIRARAGPGLRHSPVRTAGVLAVLGGLLWAPYGVFTMLEPWGAHVAFRDELGYSEVLDAGLFTLYSLPGALAALLTATAGLLLARTATWASALSRRAATGLVVAAVVLGVVSLAGVLLRLDPAFTAGRIFSTLTLGAATVVAAARAVDPSRGGRVGLLALGLLSLFLLPLWPLVHALRWLPEAGGAAVLALHGAGWALLGLRLLGAGRDDEGPPPHR